MAPTRPVRALVGLVVAAGLLGALGGTSGTRADVFLRYSGHVMQVDLREGTIVVEELGRRGQKVRHDVRIEADTRVVTASRLRLGDMRGQSAFGEMSVSLVDVLVGDFVVVEGVQAHGQTLARRVTIVETRRAP